MAIKTIGFGYEVTGYDPIDVRQVLTKEQMKTIVGDDPSEAGTGDFAMPEVYFAFCIDDGQFYKFDYEATPDPETGKFSKLELGGVTPSAETGPVAERPAADQGLPGDKWFDPETDKTYTIVVNSEGNNQWVEQAPASGEMMYDATNGKVLYFDGNTWREVGGTKETIVSDSTPSNPQPGDTWVNPDTNETKVYVIDSEGTGHWESINAKAGEMMYDETNGKILFFDGNQWREVGGLNDTATGTTAPSSPQAGDRWLDESQTPPVLKEWDGSQWKAVGAKAGDMMYDATNDVVMYFDGTEWKPIGGGVEHVSSLPVAGEEGEIVYDESTGQYKVYEDGVWLTLAKTLELADEAAYTALGGNTWSIAHPDVLIFIRS